MMRWFLLAATGIALAAPLVAQEETPKGDPAELKKLDPAYQRANGCMAATAKADAAKPASMPLITGLARVHWQLSSATAEAQRFFDQGLALIYGFEYEKAARSFARGAEIDPRCAMCKVGQALALGPYQNSGPVGPDKIIAAKKLVDEALATGRLSATERAFAEALAARYAPGAPYDDALGVHGVRYADALAALSAAHPADDVLMVAAGTAAMEVSPWEYWQADGQTPLPWAARAIKLIETVLARNPDQPQAQHLYIHVTEASTTPGRAERAADMLEIAAPASAHLVHMPSHTYYRVGRFSDGVRANKRAIEVDDAMAARLGESRSFYGYFRHHTHFLMAAAEQVGDARTALAAAAQLEAAFKGGSTRGNGYAQALLGTALQTRSQFATTAQLLALPLPDASMPVLRQMSFALRAEALARDGRIAEARREVSTMRAERRRSLVAKEDRAEVSIAENVALGRIAAARGDSRAAIRFLAKAEAIDAKLPYREPPAWHQPIEAAIGAQWLKAGNAAAAKAAFDRALVRRPGSPWALWGRAQAETAMGDTAASTATLVQVDRLWKGDKAELRLNRL
jgi:tetratricopeptide (TPR) repeat protein